MAGLCSPGGGLQTNRLDPKPSRSTSALHRTLSPKPQTRSIQPPVYPAAQPWPPSLAQSVGPACLDNRMGVDRCYPSVGAACTALTQRRPHAGDRRSTPIRSPGRQAQHSEPGWAARAAQRGTQGVGRDLEGRHVCVCVFVCACVGFGLADGRRGGGALRRHSGSGSSTQEMHKSTVPQGGVPPVALELAGPAALAASAEPPCAAPPCSPRAAGRSRSPLQHRRRCWGFEV